MYLNNMMSFYQVTRFGNAKILRTTGYKACLYLCQDTQPDLTQREESIGRPGMCEPGSHLAPGWPTTCRSSILGSLMPVTSILPALKFLQWTSKGQLRGDVEQSLESAGGEQTQRITKKKKKKPAKKETNGRARI